MTRIAVVGNSHVGAIKLGWDRVAERHPDLQVEFFAAPGIQFLRLKMLAPRVFGLPPEAPEEQRKRLQRLNGRSSVDLSAADVVLLVGRPWGFSTAAELLAGHEVDGLPETTPKPASKRLSAAAFAAFCEAIALHQGVPGPGWRGWQPPRVLQLGRPHPGEAVMDNYTVPEFRSWRLLGRSPAKFAAGMAVYFDALKRALAAEGIGLLPQPAASLGPSGLTHDALMRAAPRLIEGEYDPDNATHANADYGVLVWDSLAAHLQTKPAAA